MSSRTLLEEETRVLLQEYRRTRDVAIRNSLVLRHMGLVYQIANRYAPLARDAHEDLIQEGSVGLIRAIERFQPEYGVQFSTYAYPVISGTIKNYLRNRRRLLGQGRLEREEGREAEWGQAEPTVREGEELISPDSLETLAGQTDDDFTDQVVDRMVTTSLLGRLPSLERRIVQHFFYDDLTQREVARIVSRSTSRISRLLRQALAKIRGLLLDIEIEEDRLFPVAQTSSPYEQPGLIVPTIVDPETGLFSPYHLRRSLGRELARAQGLGAPLSLVLVRPACIPAGPGPPSPVASALAEVARRIYQQVRVLDHVFRAGPGELGLIFSLPAREASLVCERVQKKESSLDLEYAVASYPQDAHSASGLLQAARQGLQHPRPAQA